MIHTGLPSGDTIHNAEVYCSDINDIEKQLDLMIRTGCMLMESEAETSKVISVIHREAEALNLDSRLLQIHVDWNTLILSYHDHEHSYIKMQECNAHHPNLDRIIHICRTCYAAAEEKYSYDTLKQKIDKIEQIKRNYSSLQMALGSGLGCAGFSIIFGGDAFDFLITLIAAFAGSYTRMFVVKKGFNPYSAACIAAFTAIFLAWIMTFRIVNPAIEQGILPYVDHGKTWYTLMASALFLIPGVPLLTFMRDMLDGFTAISMVRAVKALVTLLAMAFGISFAITVCNRNNFATDLAMTLHHPLWVYALAGALAAIGFSIIFNFPKHLLPIIGVGGALTICCRNLVGLWTSDGQVVGTVLGPFAAAIFINIICTNARHWFKMPHQTLVIPCVITMIPGVLMYRSLYALITLHGVLGEVTTFAYNAIQAVIIILCISVGIMKPHKYFRKKPRFENFHISYKIK